jgi:hypothetical protein
MLALRAGIKDAKQKRPPYLWAAFTKPAYRSQLIHGGWKDIRTPFLVSVVLDAIYQLKQFPAYLNRWDSQQARNEGVFAH